MEERRPSKPLVGGSNPSRAHLLNRRDLLVRAVGLGAALSVPDWVWAATDPRVKSLAAAVRGPVLARGGAGYELARLEYDSVYDAVKPLAVVQPLDAADVAAVVRWAAKTGVHIVARSGGHSYGGYSTVANGVVVDLQRLKSVAVSQGHGLVGAGARLGNIYNGLGAHGLAIPAGTCPSVGIGGHALGGGFGLASRAWGLASDNMLAIQIVTADGKVVVADAKHHPDLYWACRGGGGGNFGIVTRFTFRTHAVAQGSYFVATWPWAQAAQVVASFLAWAPHQPDALGALCRLAAGPGGPTVQVFGQFLGSEAALKSALASLGPPATKLTTGTASWLDLVRRWAGCLGHPLPECALPGHTSFAGASDYIAKVPTTAQLAKFAQVVEARGRIVGRAADRRIRRSDQPRQAGSNGVRPPERAGVDPVLRRRDRRPHLGRRVPRRPRAGDERRRVRQLHRPAPRELAAGVLRREPAEAPCSEEEVRPAQPLPFPAEHPHLILAPAQGYDDRRAVAVAQLVEPRVVVPVVAGSSPVCHPSSSRAAATL